MEGVNQLKNQKYAADIDSIKEAHTRISPFIHKTPVLSSTSLDSISGKQLFFKCECFQKGGAFKIRGASNAIFSLEDDQATKGVVTHSSGNHAAAISLAAKLRGIPAYVVIPKNAPACKVENVRRYGGQVIWSEATMQSRESTATAVQQRTGANLIHPFNDKRIIRGAFKIRGASNAIFSLEDDQAAKGVVTHSSGNHAAAISLAAQLRGIPAYVVIPKNAPACKVENVRRYGGQVIWSEATMQSRESTATAVQQRTGANLIHPFNDKRIISGQGTISLELLEQVPDLDTIIVPISGGGLISGVTLAAKSINPSIRVLAAEPMGADDAARSKLFGRLITLSDTNTIADGLRAFLGDLTWPVVRDLVDDVVVLDENEIIKAMRLCYEVLKLAVEPSGAIGLAAILSDQCKQKSYWKDMRKIAIVLSGGNVDLGVLWESLK